MPPLYLSSNYSFAGFDQKRKYDYCRSGNPTRDVLAETLAELEGGAGCVVTATGMAAVDLPLSLLEPGDLLIAPHDCYGGTHRLLCARAKKGHFEVLWVDQGDPVALDAALALNPKLVLVETPSNPLLRVVDIADICVRAHAVGAKVVADNTFLSPALQTADRAGRRHRDPLDDQIHQRPLRRGRRRGDRGGSGGPCGAGLVGQLPGRHRVAVRRLSDPARRAHPVRPDRAAAGHGRTGRRVAGGPPGRVRRSTIRA